MKALLRLTAAAVLAPLATTVLAAERTEAVAQLDPERMAQSGEVERIASPSRLPDVASGPSEQRRAVRVVYPSPFSAGRTDSVGR